MNNVVIPVSANVRSLIWYIRNCCSSAPAPNDQGSSVVMAVGNFGSYRASAKRGTMSRGRSRSDSRGRPVPILRPIASTITLNVKPSVKAESKIEEEPDVVSSVMIIPFTDDQKDEKKQQVASDVTIDPSGKNCNSNAKGCDESSDSDPNLYNFGEAPVKVQVKNNDQSSSDDNLMNSDEYYAQK